MPPMNTPEGLLCRLRQPPATGSDRQRRRCTQLAAVVTSKTVDVCITSTAHADHARLQTTTASGSRPQRRRRASIDTPHEVPASVFVTAWVPSTEGGISPCRV
jgi:hypothetical protein